MCGDFAKIRLYCFSQLHFSNNLTKIAMGYVSSLWNTNDAPSNVSVPRLVLAAPGFFYLFPVVTFVVMPLMFFYVTSAADRDNVKLVLATISFMVVIFSSLFATKFAFLGICPGDFSGSYKVIHRRDSNSFNSMFFLASVKNNFSFVGTIITLLVSFTLFSFCIIRAAISGTILAIRLVPSRSVVSSIKTISRQIPLASCTQKIFCFHLAASLSKKQNPVFIDFCEAAKQHR